MKLTRRALLAGGAVAAAAPWPLAGLPSARAQDGRFFRIATGPVDGAYFSIGTLIGNIVSSPPGARECDRGGSCGVPGLIAVTQTTAGPLANVDLIASKRMESALCQADIAYWAFHGTGLYRKQGAVSNLRAIANLYPETMHVVTRQASKIDDFRKLRGKSVSLGEQGSSTLVTARAILQSLGVNERDLKGQFLTAPQAAEALEAGKIDAFFHMTGVPSPVVKEVATAGDVTLLPIGGQTARKLRGAFPFLTETTIPGEIYQGIGETPSLSVGVLWVVADEVDEKIVYGLTRALFHPNNRKALDAGHSFGRFIRAENALDGVALQVHAGAALYYFETGLIR